MLLILITYSMIFVAFFFIELHEAHSQGTAFSLEFAELIAILAVMLVTAPFSLVVAWTIAGRILRPLKQVLQTAEDIRSGNLDERIPAMPQPDELSRLAQTINDAFDRYASAVKRLEHFSSDASHQLRTPLAVIRTSAEVSLQSDRSTHEYKDALGGILEQTQKLNQTIDQLLILSRLDSTMQESFQPVNLADLNREWIKEAGEFLDDRTIELTIEDAGFPLLLDGNEILLKEVFSNLLNNALVIMPADGVIHVHVKTDGRGFAEWRFEDSGPGIPPDEMTRIFDRFYRGKNATHSGSGLGLAIVKQIVLLHNGTVHAEKSASLGGACFRIIFPIKQNAIS